MNVYAVAFEKSSRWLILILLTMSLFEVMADNYAQNNKAKAFISEMVQKHGFSSELLEGYFQNTEPKQSILSVISRPAEKTKTWTEYEPIFLTKARIEKGLDFWRRHATALERAEHTYGVPAEIIVAIIGVETFYGGNMGNYSVMDALSTLAFDYPPRSPFFTEQLENFLLLTREQEVNPLTLKGSYAGAMGLPQFMPSSYRNYAVDFDGDGHINIWSDATDAIGSVANYLKGHGWVSGQPVVVPAQVDADVSARIDKSTMVTVDQIKPYRVFKQEGWGTRASVPDDEKVLAFSLNGPINSQPNGNNAIKGYTYWLGLTNFLTITKYNRSVLYAMAVYELGHAIRTAREGGE